MYRHFKINENNNIIFYIEKKNIYIYTKEFISRLNEINLAQESPTILKNKSLFLFIICFGRYSTISSK